MTNPTALTNSKRRHEKRTYTPLINADPANGDNSDALGLAAMVRSLMVSTDELTQLRESVQGQGQVDHRRHSDPLARCQPECARSRYDRIAFKPVLPNTGPGGLNDHQPVASNRCRSGFG